jgi:hypothetical protein
MQEIKEILKVEKEADNLIQKTEQELESSVSKLREEKNSVILQQKLAVETANQLKIKEHIQKLKKEQEKIRELSDIKVKNLHQIVERNSEQAENFVLRMALK